MSEQPSRPLNKPTQPRKPDFKKPYFPSPYDDQIAAAVTAVAQGNATQGQQQLTIDWIITSVCGFYDMSYRPDDRDTAFAEGKRFVASQIIKMTRMKVGRLQGGNYEIV